LAAASLVARIRGAAVQGRTEFPPELVKELGACIGRIEVELDPLTEALAGLHRDAPVRVVHGDLVPKNLVTDGTSWTVVDWPLAHLAPHLSDLYTLIRDAVALGHDRGRSSPGTSRPPAPIRSWSTASCSSVARASASVPSSSS
jgi:Ser/Thr protein kinase RdoA (MazF antagonist)